MLWNLFRKICPLPALSLLIALAAFVSLDRPAVGDAFTYGTGASRTVNAGILLLDEAQSGNNSSGQPMGPDNSDPYVFHVLNERSDIKPFGWSIVNPLAPKDVTAAIQLRWNNRSNSTTYQIGQNVTPAMAPYWEVSLTDRTSDDLAQFDILLINLRQPVMFTVADSEKLRRFVDGGGTLWIENSGGGDVLGDPTSANYGPLFFDLRFQSNATAGGYATIPSAARNPIISTPYQLSETELSSLGDKHIGVYYSSANNPAVAPGPGFTTVIGNSGTTAHLPVIAAEQFGAGQVVVTCTGSANTINNYVGGTNIGFGYNSGPYSGVNYTNAPAQDLKLLSDIIATDLHPTEHKNSHQTGNAINALSSPALAWSDTSHAGGGIIPTGAVVNGHIAYVTGTDGALRAYDIYPSEDLDGDGNPDDGTQDPAGSSYDMIWQASGPYASAPTLGALPDGTQAVFVEDAKGVVSGFNAVTMTLTPLSGTQYKPNAGAGVAFTGSAPSPTVFGGRLYAALPDGTLFVYDFNTGASASGGQVYNPNSANPRDGTEHPTASPTVGLLPQDTGGNGSDIVAFLPTNMNVYSIYLGARGEQLGPTGNTNSPFTTKLKVNAAIDAGTTPVSRAYSLTNGLPVLPFPRLTPAGNTFTGTATGTFFGDYDPDFSVAAGAPESLTRTHIGIGIGGSTGTISAPALDGNGNIYYISNEGGRSSLSCFHDATQASNVLLKWRFQLPRLSDPAGYVVDADGTDYRAAAVGSAFRDLSGFQFVGTPIVDNQGLVYALARNTGNGVRASETAVLCFSSLGGVSADVQTPDTGTQINNVRVTQPDPLIAGNDLLGNTNGPPTIPGGQFTIGATGHIDINSFAQPTRSANFTNNTIPDLVEPYPISASFTAGGGNANGTQATLVRLHTNLSWYTIVGAPTGPVVANTGGMTKVGNRLFFVDTSGKLDSLVADPAAEGFTIGLKYVPPVQTSGSSTLTMLTQSTNSGVGSATGVPCAANGAIIVNGTNGVAAYTNQITIVVDSSRVMEMDTNGDAQWAVDATTKTALAGGAASTFSGGTGQVVTTTLDLNRPSSLTELTQNDYLVADTGNNRCVRFDRSGNVIWELTKFTDPNNLLTPGDPDTLNQPTSVQIYSRTIGAGVNAKTYIQYLISDTGNYRVVEVDDVYDSTGKNLVYHALEWISRTHDTQGRSYRYQSAAYYYAPSGNQYIVALATNSRIGQPTGSPATAPAASNQDAGGGSIVLLYYTPPGSPVTTATDGTVAYTISDFYANLNNNNTFDQATAAGKTANLAAVSVPANATLMHIRNPRYLKVYVPKGGGSDDRNYLIADDNGVFDLVQTLPDANGKRYFVARWGFTQADYQQLNTPIIVDGTAANKTFSRANVPFIATSVQLLPTTDTVTYNGTDYQIGRYLITNSYSQGEAANQFNGPPGFGGEVFELYHTATGTAMADTYSQHTLSRPSNTSALSQPAFAYRLQ